MKQPIRTNRTHLIILITLLLCLMGVRTEAWAVNEIPTSGTYNMTGNVSITKTISLAGHLTIKCNGAARSITRNGDFVMFKTNGYNLTITGASGKVITINGNNKKGNLIECTGAGTLSLSYVNLQNAKDTSGNDGRALVINGTGNATYSNGLIQSCTSQNGPAVSLGGSTSQYTVTLTNVEIKNCNATAANGEGCGGTIRSGGTVLANLILDNCNIHNNTSGGMGGGVYWNAGATIQNATNKLTIKNGTKIQNNTSTTAGGGIFVESAMTITSATISGNTSGTNGGGIDVHAHVSGTVGVKPVSISGCTISGNTAATGGGGMYIEYPNETITLASSVNVQGNTTTSGNGGGVYLLTGNLTITGAKINSTNKAENGNGGGIYTNSGTLIVQTSAEVSSNKAKNGGGIFANGGTVTVTSSTIASNTASNNGGGLYATGSNTTVSVSGSSSSKSSLTSNTAVNGGAIYADAKSVTIGYATIGTSAAPNTVTGNGGGVYAKAAVNVNTGAAIEYNRADGHGGGLYVNDGVITMKAGSVQYNYAGYSGTASKHGGGFYVTGGDTPTSKVDIQGGNIRYNHADNGNGGGIYVAKCSTDGTSLTGTTKLDSNQAKNGAGAFINSGKLVINSANCEVNSNIATASGGGVYVADGTATMSNASVQSNTAATNGGGIYANGTTSLSSVTLSGNTASSGNGGGLYGLGAVTVTGGTMSNNHANNGKGGGIYAEAGSNTILIQTSAQINSNTANNGAGIYAQSGTVSVQSNSTLTSNTATGDGGGIYANGGTVNVSASANTTKILYQNQAANGGAIYANGGTVNFSNGTIEGNYATQCGGGLYIPASGTLKLMGTATLTANHVPARQLGGGVYLEGIVQAGNNQSDIITVADNYAGATGNLNNIYLPNPLDTQTQDIITVVKNGLDRDQSRIGFSVPHNFVPVVYCNDATYLQDLYDNHPDAIFEDSDRYTKKYFPSSSTYSPNYIYLAADTWAFAVIEQPDGFNINNIDTPQKLAWIISLVNGLHGETADDFLNKEITVTADLDMKAYSWVPIGMTKTVSGTTTVMPFKGTFNGNGHTISNIYCSYLGNDDTGTGPSLGLFGTVDGATIHDVFLNGVELDVRNQTSGTYSMGAIANEAKGSTSIYNCTAESKMESTMANTTMGGLVGSLASGGTIHSSAAMPDMTGYTMGGLVGTNAGNIYNSFANAKFTYSGTNQYMGGLVAVNTGCVENCYSRIQGTAPTSSYFGYLAGNNTSTSGKGLYSCYATNTTYVATATGTTTGNQTSLNTYGTVVAPYLYNHSNDNLVGSTGINLCAMLNTWVQNTSNGWNNTTMTNANGYAQWKRTTAGGYSTGAGNINDDYPIHKMVGLSNAASPDGLFIEYKYSLDAMLDKYNDLEDGGTVWVYDSPLSAMTASGGTPSYESVSVDNAAKVKLYIDEEASLLQYYNANSASDNNTLTAYTSQTLPGSPRSWHFLSSSLSNSGIGFNYAADGVGFNWDPNPCGVTISGNDDAALFPSDLGDVAKMDLYAFYEPEYHWINLKRDSNSHWHMNATTLPISYTNETTLTPGKGYLVSIDQDQLLQNKGTLNNGKVSIDLNYTPANAWAGLLGYNLIGNPYQSYLDFNAFVTYTPNAGLWYDNSKGADMEPTYAVYDASMGGYIQYKKGSSRGSKSATGILNMHQGFMIRVASAGKSAHFTNDMRTNDGAGVSFRGDQPAYPLINLTVTDDKGVNDFAVLELGRDRDEGAEKLRANDSKGWLYLHHGSEDYGILFRSEVDDYQPLWFEAEEAGTYTLGWETANAEFEALTLIDNITGVVTDMLVHDRYTFEATPEQYASRFKIVIGDYKDIEENEAPEPVEGPTFAYVNNGNIVLAGLETEGEASLQIIDMTGRVILCRDASHASVISTDGIASGIYILRLTDGKGTKIQKIVIE